MDDIWIKTVRQLEKELADYRMLKSQSSSALYSTVSPAIELDLGEAKALLDQKYSQIIGFMAGLADDSVEFDCDLDSAAIVISRKSGTSYIFGPGCVSSSAPHLSAELTQFIAESLRNKNRDVTSLPDALEERPAGMYQEPALMGYFEAKQAVRDRMTECRNHEVDESDSNIPGALRFALEIERLRQVHHTRAMDTECFSTAPNFEYLSW